MNTNTVYINTSYKNIIILKTLLYTIENTGNMNTCAYRGIIHNTGYPKLTPLSPKR